MLIKTDDSFQFPNCAISKCAKNKKSGKKNYNIELWLSRRRKLAEQAKQYLPNLFYELGVTNLNKNFSCSIFNPHHADHTTNVTYYADTPTVHCHGCGFHGNIFQVYSVLFS